MIHKTAIVDPKAKISSNITIGAYSVIGPDVEIDENTIIHSHVNISGHTKIGKENKRKQDQKNLQSIKTNVYNTMDPDSTIRSRKKVGPKIVGTGSIAGDFDVAFFSTLTTSSSSSKFRKIESCSLKIAETSAGFKSAILLLFISQIYMCCERIFSPNL